MKKFTKGCLITALVLFIFGCAFYGICGFMGGFQQLEAWRGHPFRLWGHEMRLAYSGYGFWYITDDDSQWEITDLMDGANSIGADEKEQTTYSASDIRNIEIECGGNNLVIQESPDDYIWIARDSEARSVKYKAQNGTFRLYSEKSFRWWNARPWGTIYLYLPKGMSLDSFDLEIGAGALNSIALEAKEIDVEVDAGTAVIESLTGNEVDLVVNAGGLEINDVTAVDLSAETGAGSLVIQNFSTEDASFHASAGSLDLGGKIGRNADMECGAGSIHLTLQGAETDYDYDLECSMGEININENTYSGLSSERTIRNDGRGVLDIECSVGSIEVEFTD